MVPVPQESHGVATSQLLRVHCARGHVASWNLCAAQSTSVVENTVGQAGAALGATEHPPLWKSTGLALSNPESSMGKSWLMTLLIDCCY